MFNALQWLAGLFSPMPKVEIEPRRKPNRAGTKMRLRAMNGTLGQRSSSEFGRNLTANRSLQQKAAMKARKKKSLSKSHSARKSFEHAAMQSTPNAELDRANDPGAV